MRTTNTEHVQNQNGLGHGNSTNKWQANLQDPQPNPGPEIESYGGHCMASLQTLLQTLGNLKIYVGHPSSVHNYLHVHQSLSSRPP